MPSHILDSLRWRCVGPFRGGRTVAASGDPHNPSIYYFGTTGGGVWKTDDGGQYWVNISDGFFQRASVGALEVAPSDSNVIYAGMGETTIRGNVSHGDGVYKSVDAGKTWSHLGLAATRNIGKLRVDPRDPDTVFVAAFGHAHGPNPERGVYRTKDGGATWELVLHRSENAGACDISIDPINPRNVYAAIWEARRGPYFLTSGGEGSGLFKSADGGDSWTEITRNQGLPSTLIGKIGVSVSGAQRDRVYAIVEAEEGGVFRSDDGGDTWTRLSEDRNLRQRAWYYSHIIADPSDADTVWVLNVEMFRSIDAGATFKVVTAPHGDNHDLWIDPRDSRRMILANDGGGTVSVNNGRSWSSQYSQPTAELYHVTVDSCMPYRLYGSQQDNTSISVPSRSNYNAITRTEWYEVGGGEAGYIAVRPDNPNIIHAGEYMGFMTRYDHERQQARNISVWPADQSGHGAIDYRYRFQWTYPILLSPHDPNVLYCSGNHVFRSTDEGSSWETISPDLTRNDPTTMQPSGGPITKDNTGTEVYGTIFALAESPKKAGVIWAGSDDGLIHVTKNGGKKWTAVTPAGLPEWSLVSVIEASPHDAARAYAAINRYKHDDFAPYIYRTVDHGKSWTKITEGIPDDVFVRVVREDPVVPGMLYAGTETGIYLSWNDGQHWERLGGNFPVVPVHDLIVHADDLVVGTHGRSFWILDDVTLLRQIGKETALDSPRLFTPKPAYRYGSMPAFGHGTVVGKNYTFAATQMPAFTFEPRERDDPKVTWLDAGENPPDGVIVQYWLPEEPAEQIELAFCDESGTVLRSIKSYKKEPEHKEEVFPPEPGDKIEVKETHCTAKAGLNRFTWDLQMEPATRIDSKGGDQPDRSGPRVVPGTYRVRLTAGDQTREAKFDVRQDPRQDSTAADLKAQFDLLRQIHDTHDRLNKGVNRARSIRTQAIAWAQAAKQATDGEAVIAGAKKLSEALDGVEGELLQMKIQSEQDSLNYPIKLNSQLVALGWMIGSADAAPTSQAVEACGELTRAVDKHLAALEAIVESEVPAFNALVEKAGLLKGVTLPA